MLFARVREKANLLVKDAGFDASVVLTHGTSDRTFYPCPAA
ncbi:hypothetical protein [Sphingomonas chungangi]|nr:hypothetical protein [Sphingomonas chungangi]